MTKIGLIRCEKNESRCPGDGLVNMARILKSKGADTIHFCTFTFARRGDGKWIKSGDGL